jgi:carbonic anhydrase
VHGQDCRSASRVGPTRFASTDPGDLFVSRSVGNLVAPAAPGGASTADESEAAAIEYAVLRLHVKDVVVCGHSNCAAMEAVLDDRAEAELHNLSRWLRHARPARDRFLAGEAPDPTLSPADQISQLNVLLQMEHVRSYPAVKDAEARSVLAVHGFWFDVRTADVYAYEEEVRRFVLIDEAEGARLLAKVAPERAGAPADAR